VGLNQLNNNNQQVDWYFFDSKLRQTSLRSYVISQMLKTLILVFLITLVIFFLFHVIEVDFIVAGVGDTFGLSPSPSQIASLKSEMGVNNPIIVRYFYWMRDMFTGNWGISIYGKP